MANGEWGDMACWLVCGTYLPLTHQKDRAPGIPLAIHRLPFTASLTRTDADASALQVLQDFVQHFLGITKQHAVVFLIEQRVVHPGVTGCH
jgi:hypothetical protein